jgi:hypothetical protein
MKTTSIAYCELICGCRLHPAKQQQHTMWLSVSQPTTLARTALIIPNCETSPYTNGWNPFVPGSTPPNPPKERLSYLVVKQTAANSGLYWSRKGTDHNYNPASSDSVFRGPTLAFGYVFGSMRRCRRSTLPPTYGFSASRAHLRRCPARQQADN